MRDMIFVSLEDWDEVWRRNQFLCAEWLQRFPGMQILFVGRSRDYSNSLRTGNWDSLRKPSFYQASEFPGLSVLNPRKLLPNTLSLCRRWNAYSCLHQIRAAAETLGMREPLLWINDHFARHLAGKLGERGVVYDVTDDWTQMPSISKTTKKRIVEEDRELCKKADLVIVCSKALEISRAPRSRRIERVPNGVDAAHYKGLMDDCKKRDTPSLAPVFGYLGTLHGDRLDIELVLTLARHIPQGRVVLCGPDYLRVQERQRLLSEGNVELKPPVPYRDVPSILAGFDVCIVPHHINAFTESLNPLKLWAYLACGKPIASTPVAGFSDYPNLVYLGSGPDGFPAACFKALQEGALLSGQRVREAEAHSWEVRVDQLTEIFRQEGWLGRRSARRPHNNGIEGELIQGDPLGEVCHG